MKQEQYNSDWLFWNDTDSFALVWNIPENAQKVTLPHDAMLSEQPYADSKNGGNTGFRDGKNHVYVKKLTVKEDELSQRKILKFEGSHMNTFVYVNGQLAGKHHNGYTSFYVPIHDFLHEGENEVRVQVRNGAMSNSRWYSGGGLYRDVYLLTSDLLHIEGTGSRIKTLDLEKDLATIEVTVPIENEEGLAKQFDLEVRVLNSEGQVVQKERRPYFIGAGEKNEYRTSLVLESIVAWSIETPALYNLQATIYQEGEQTDQDMQTFGIRTLSVDPKRGFRVNGKSVNLRGACIHHDSGLIGAATYETAHRRQIRILKEAGFNAIRMAHHPAAPALLKVCDELGMYVMDETFDMWTRFKGDFDYSLFFEENWEKDVTAMVLTDFNHPSVVLYSIGNEIPEIGTPHGSRLAKAIHDRIQKLDPTRPTLAGINGVFAAGDVIPQIMADIVAQNEKEGVAVTGNVNDFMSLMDTNMDQIVVHPLISQKLRLATAATDIAGYNYMTARYELDAQENPNRVIVGSETYPPEIARNWSLVEKLPSVIGDFTWTGWDYIGEAGVGVPAYQWGEGGFGAQFPCQLAYCGDIDITGFRRPLSYYREIVFGLRKDPYIAVQKPEHFGKKLIKTPWVLSDAVHSWTWTGYEGQPVVVEVYGAGDTVALYLDGDLVDQKEIGKNLGCLATFEMQYQPGELKAVLYKDGKIVGEQALYTADTSTIHLKAQLEENEELTYVSLELVDSNGCLVSNDDQELMLEVSGADLLGFGSGNPKPMDHYLEAKTKTFGGRALAILKKKGSQAHVTIHIKGEQTVLEF